jgi:hypothetical protein
MYTKCGSSTAVNRRESRDRTFDIIRELIRENRSWRFIGFIAACGLLEERHSREAFMSAHL